MSYVDTDVLKKHAVDYVRTHPHFHYGDWEHMCINGKEIDEIIDTCPQIQNIKQKEGRWIEHAHYNTEGSYNGSNYECSNCHYSEVYDIEDMDYCNKCGTKMKGIDYDE